MINSVTVIGRLGMDPEIRTTESGTSVASFRLANHEYRQVNGERQTVTHWFHCVAFGSLAQLCAEFVQKGAKVGIHGKLRQRLWETPDGDKRSTIEIHVRDIEFLSRDGIEEKLTQ